jgi:large subunit ribosomal protein L28
LDRGEPRQLDSDGWRPRVLGSPEINQEIPVASVCDVCGKRPGFGHNVPWSKKKTNRRWEPNIQTVRVDAGGGNTRRLNVCTSCSKAGKVLRAARG